MHNIYRFTAGFEEHAEIEYSDALRDLDRMICEYCETINAADRTTIGQHKVAKEILGLQATLLAKCLLKRLRHDPTLRGADWNQIATRANTMLDDPTVHDELFEQLEDCIRETVGCLIGHDTDVIIHWTKQLLAQLQPVAQLRVPEMTDQHAKAMMTTLLPHRRAA